MKNKILKSSTVVVLLLVMAIALLGCCNCPKDDGNLDNNTNAVPEYDTVFSTAIRICHFNEIKNWDYKSKLETVTSLSDLEKFNILGEGYTEEYFEYNVILLIKFTYASSDDNIQFKDLAISGSKFYPIFETNSPLPNQPSTGDIGDIIFVVKAPKTSYEFGDILVINRRDITAGSCYHESITTVFQ